MNETEVEDSSMGAEWRKTASFLSRVKTWRNVISGEVVEFERSLGRVRWTLRSVGPESVSKSTFATMLEALSDFQHAYYGE